MKAPEKYRLNKPGYKFSTTEKDGNNGTFKIPHHRITDYFYFCIVSDGMGWEHVSVSLMAKKKDVKRCPTWEEMCFIKDLFWSKTESVIQFHPPAEQYVSTHPYCLHLWRATDPARRSPVPPLYLVGPEVKELPVTYQRPSLVDQFGVEFHSF